MAGLDFVIVSLAVFHAASSNGKLVSMHLVKSGWYI